MHLKAVNEFVKSYVGIFSLDPVDFSPVSFEQYDLELIFSHKK